ncbi:MAG: hypothetical protein BZ136_04665, partial [Methanosphaera sp. rholeuAM74]
MSADSYYTGENLTTIEEGTVSGGLYSDSYFGYDDHKVNVDYSNTINNEQTNTQKDNDQSSGDSQTNTQTPTQKKIKTQFNDSNLTYVYKPLPSNAKIQSAHLIIGVYMTNMAVDYPINMTLEFNGITYVNKTLSCRYDHSVGKSVIDENISRVTSDYLIHLNVTDNVKVSGNYLSLEMVNANESLGGDPKIKLATLLVAYDDGDYDTYYYTINLGHDVANIDDGYVGSTTFKGVYSGSRVYDAELKSYYLASQNGVYKFNNKALESTPPQGGYDGISTWNVTRSYKRAADNTLTYQRSASAAYFKIIFATMQVKFYNSEMSPDLSIRNVKINPNNYDYNNSIFLDQENEVVVDLENTGTRNANSFNVTLTVGNDTYTQNVTNLSSMQETSVTFKFNYTSAAEDVDLNVVVDAENIVTEVSKKDNRYNENYQAIYTKFPDLNVEGVIIEDELLINNASTVKINISNIG